ncbi:tyrosine-type recombinase/integrase [Paenibacillus humicus]|uniref:tyrosine-type recombinase/integrase n=1 Tax=Paenibacillus humicus TaxID=412861 RepID=UPI000FDBDD32|nr:tyrosine-type recombinase/integrase [Paenibacillus humicus]
MSQQQRGGVPQLQFKSKRDKPLVFDFQRAVTEFLYAKRIEKRSPRTLLTYEQTLSQLGRWLADKGHRNVDSEVIRDYVHYLSFEKTRWDDHPTSPNGVVGLSPRSVNNIIRNLRSFFNHHVKERTIAYSPMDAIRYQTEDKDTFEVFTDDEVKRLLDAPNRRVFTGLRDYCMMLVLIDTACRVGELTQLRISDVDLKTRTITFRAEITKTKTTRVIPISKRTAKEVEVLISFMNVESSDFLWLSQFGERYFADSFSKMLKKYGKKAGVTNARVSPHTFRHYAAVSLLKGGMDAFQVSRLLGHSSVRVTEIYVKYTESDIINAHETASPVTRLVDSGNFRKSGKTRFQ